MAFWVTTNGIFSMSCFMITSQLVEMKYKNNISDISLHKPILFSVHIFKVNKL